MARTNCHTSPTVMTASSGRIMDSMPLPLAMAGATIQDRTPMGMAAAAQIMKMPFLLYCVTVIARAAGAPPIFRSMVVVIFRSFLGGWFGSAGDQQRDVARRDRADGHSRRRPRRCGGPARL